MGNCFKNNIDSSTESLREYDEKGEEVLDKNDKSRSEFQVGKLKFGNETSLVVKK